MSTAHSNRIRLLALCAFAGAACTAPESRQASPYAPAPDPRAGPPAEIQAHAKAWTDSFLKPSVLVATEIRIEGPDGLLAHVVTRADPDFHERVEKTVPLGFLQQITLKEGVGEAEIKGQIDNLSVVATQRLIVIEKPGPGDVTVTARGDAYWSDRETKAERRGEVLTFVGKIAR